MGATCSRRKAFLDTALFQGDTGKSRCAALAGKRPAWREGSEQKPTWSRHDSSSSNIQASCQGSTTHDYPTKATGLNQGSARNTAGLVLQLAAKHHITAHLNRATKNTLGLSALRRKTGSINVSGVGAISDLLGAFVMAEWATSAAHSQDTASTASTLMSKRRIASRP